MTAKRAMTETNNSDIRIVPIEEFVGDVDEEEALRRMEIVEHYEFYPYRSD